MKKNIAVIAGDGIGPEIMAEALKALNCVQELYGHQFDIVPVCAGGCAIDQYGTSLPKESLQKCLDSDSVLLGAVGGPKRRCSRCARRSACTRTCVRPRSSRS